MENSMSGPVAWGSGEAGEGSLGGPVIVGLVQERWHPDTVEHAQALRRGVMEAAGRGAQLVCLQELTLHRYFADTQERANFDLAEPLRTGPTSALCSDLAREANAYVVGSLFERAETAE